jgi:hypothetical protein
MPINRGRVPAGLMGEGPPLVRTATRLTHLEVEYRNNTWRHYLRELGRRRR